MATIVCCDRCRAEAQVVPVLGVDMCNACIADFKKWVTQGTRTNIHSLKMARGGYQDAIIRLLERDGCVTPDSLAAATGAPRRNAHDALRHEKGAGRLGQSGRCRYVAPEREAAE